MKKRTIKIINNKPEKKIQRKLYLKNYLIPTVKSYFNKVFFALIYGSLTLMILRLFGYSLTPLNLLSATALYFFLEDLKHLIITITKK